MRIIEIGRRGKFQNGYVSAGWLEHAFPPSTGVDCTGSVTVIIVSIHRNPKLG
jgi:hypothetical protein